MSLSLVLTASLLTASALLSPTSSQPAPVIEAAPETVSIAAVGDSITSWHGDAPAGETWVVSLPDASTTFAGGTAKSAMTTQWMAANIAPTGATVTVILAGTNDVRHGLPIATSLADIDRIAAVAGGRIIVSAIAPSDQYGAQVQAFNAALLEHVRAAGWQWADPFATIRTDAGTFKPGTAIDGIHPTVPVERLMASCYRYTAHHPFERHTVQAGTPLE